MGKDARGLTWLRSHNCLVLDEFRANPYGGGSERDEPDKSGGNTGGGKPIPREPGAVNVASTVWRGLRLARASSPAVGDDGPDHASPAVRDRVLRRGRSRARRRVDRKNVGRTASERDHEPRHCTRGKPPTRGPLRGRPDRSRRDGEVAGVLPGSVPTAGVQRPVCAHGRARRGKRRLEGRTR